MALTNEQYNSLMRIFSKRRLNALSLAEETREVVYKAHEDVKELHTMLSKNAASRAKAKILNQQNLLSSLDAERTVLKSKEQALYVKYNLSESDFLPIYTCKDCEDTGFIGEKKCHCFLQAEIDLLYADSNLGVAIANDSFEKVDYSLYEKTSVDNAPSQLDKMKAVVKTLKKYVEDFDKTHQSLLFLGQSGLGKTFFSNCIAKALLNTGHSVVYFSAVSLFELFAQNRNSFDKESVQQMNDAILSSDLLIIDDLGTETLNSYTTGKFFSVINDRLLRGKATIISSNLSRNQLSDIYGERIASRILSGYEHFLFSGDDLRIKIKLRKL